MQRNHQATRVAHAISSARFVLISPGGQERVRDMLSVTQLQPDGVNHRRVMRFLAPGDVRNTATLIIEQAGAQDDIWVYLPALKKTRRIASDNKKGSFVGSDLSYADMVGHRPADWTHTVLRSEALGGGKTWVVESPPRTAEVGASSGYGKRLTWVAETKAVTLKADFFDPNGQLLKTVENSDLQPVQGQPQKWVVMKVQVKNHQTGHRTQVIVSTHDSQTPVGDEYFSTRWIEKEQ